MNNMKRLFIEEMADRVRNECKVGDYGFQNIFEAAEMIGYRVIRYPIGSDAFLGFALIKDTERIVFSNSSLILSREIFTAAHEIGHQRLHLSDQGITIIKDNDFNEINEFEIEANYFAASLLMPADQVNKFIRLELKNKPINNWDGLDIARMQTAFNVSYDMALVRLKALGILDDMMTDVLKEEKQAKTASRLLNAISGNASLCKPVGAKKIPAEYLDWAISNYKERLIPLKSLETALNYVDLRAEDFVDTSEEPEIDEGFDGLLKGME